MNELEFQFFAGNMLSCYELLKQEKHADEKFQNLLMHHQIQHIPTFENSAVAQSVEKSDETYLEDELFKTLRKIQDEEKFLAEIKKLEQTSTSDDAKSSAHSFYTQGSLFLHAHHYQEAVYCYQQAVKKDPSKGLYFGIVAQTMQRLNLSPIEALGYAEAAIRLNSNNARWYLVKSLLLVQMAKDLERMEFLDSAIYEIQLAEEYCMQEQASLKQAIDACKLEINQMLMQ